MTNGFDQLEQELLDAERRQAAREETHGGSEPRRWRRFSGVLVPLLGAAIAIVVAGGALLLAPGHKAAPSRRSAANAGVRSLVGELGVLRRSQTAADRALYAGRSRAEQSPSTPLDQSIRGLTRAIRLPNDGKIFLYIVAPGGGQFPFGLGYEERSQTDGFGACCLTSILGQIVVLRFLGRSSWREAEVELAAVEPGDLGGLVGEAGVDQDGVVGA